MKPVCSICLSQVGRKTRFITSCNHKFHSKCLLIWVIGNNTCPVCRKNLKEDETIIDNPIIEDEEMRNLREIFYIITEVIMLRES